MRQWRTRRRAHVSQRETRRLNILIVHGDPAMADWLAKAANDGADTVSVLSREAAFGAEAGHPDFVIVGEGSGETEAGPFSGEWRARTRRGAGAYILALIGEDRDALATLDDGADDYAIDRPSEALATRIRVARRFASERVQQRSRLRDGIDLFESISYAVIAFDLQGQVRWVNGRAARESGFTAEEMVGQPAQRFLASGSNFDEGAVIAEALRCGSAKVESELVGADGRTAHARIAVSPIHAQGELAGFLTVVEDISEQRRALQELERAHDLFESVFSQTLAGIVITDAVGRFVWVNDAALGIMGRPREEVVGQSLDLLFPEAWRKDLMERYLAVIAAPGPLEPIDLHVVRPNGTRSYVTLTRATFRGPGGEAYGVTSLVDITALKDAQEEAAGLAAIIESTEEAIISRDREGRIISWGKY